MPDNVVRPITGRKIIRERAYDGDKNKGMFGYKGNPDAPYYGRNSGTRR